MPAAATKEPATAEHAAVDFTALAAFGSARSGKSKRRALPAGQLSLEDTLTQHLPPIEDTLHCMAEGDSKESAFRHTVRLYDFQGKSLLEIQKAEEDGIKNILLELFTGGGKCLGKDTPILMYDGSIKAVQDVQVGDELIGPDAMPRIVLSTCQGREMMYEIRPKDPNEMSWTCNQSHILSVVTHVLGLRKDILISESISISEIIKETDSVKISERNMTGWRSEICFDSRLPRQREVKPFDFNILPIGEGDYFGLEITGDRLFMLGDFTVTHNTVVAGAFIEDRLKRDKRVLFLANRDILIGQAIDKFETKLGLHPLREQAQHRAIHKFGTGAIDTNCVVGSVQTLHDYDRLHEWPSDAFDYIISDEAHRCVGTGWRMIRSHFPNAIHLGLSATPRAALEAGLFQKHIKPITLAQGIEGGFLVRPEVHRVKTDIDLSSIGLVGKGAEKDFNKKQLDEIIFRETSKLASSIKQKVGKMRCAIFAPSVASAEALAAALCDLELSCECVSYLSPDARGTIQRFADKEFQAISNAVILTEGWDDGDIEVLVICNPSVNRDRYVQIIGRGLRLPETIEKTKCIILDYAGVSDKHDLMHSTDVFIDGDLSTDENMALRKRARQLVDSGKERDALKAVQMAQREIDEEMRRNPNARRKHEIVEVQEKIVVFDPIYSRVLGMPTQMPARQAVQVPATLEQKQLITRMSKGKLPVEGLSKEAAQRAIIDLKYRLKNDLAMPAQLDLMRLLGCPLEQRLNMTKYEATQFINNCPKPKWWKGRP